MRRRAIALPTVLLMLSVLAIVVTAMLILGESNLTGIYQQVQTDQALVSAETGCWWGLLQLAQNTAWTPPAGNTTLPNTQAQYHVDLYAAGSTTPQGVVVPSGLTYLLSTGATANGKTRKVGMMVQSGVGALNYAALTANGITVQGGSHIDTVDPLTGLPLSTPASVAVESASAGITLSGGASISGSAYLAPGAPMSQISITGGSSISGSQGLLTSVVPMPPVTLPSDPTGLPPTAVTGGSTTSLLPGTYGDLTVNGGSTLTLAPGIYVLNSLDVTGGGHLAISGPVQIYLANGLNVLVGALLNPTKDPNNMKFLVASGSVNVDSGGTTYGVVYAPASPVVLKGDGVIYGSLIGNSLLVDGGSYLHYDPNAGPAAGGGATTARVVSQQSL